MAQRDHKQEEPTELRAPEITLCANSCGFPGNPATHNLCQNCFLAGPASTSPSSSSSSSLPGVSVSTPVVDRPRPAPVEVELAVDLAPARTSVNRCSSCRKRVGLTGFRCRCGDMFCGEHRYSDRHGCSYDYKAAARDAIARDNPVVRAAKIVRF
ncbi:hypothetical protein CFC21_066374 [Triticum aestivum]|uniref:Uncharacterized protein n=3 Tax=Triticum TaxID=4564 RepID=A0A9R0TUW6_TRITD|nr:zinc finger A20 and AN1 domain-containing stress-associated protein 1-like [Triticum dicoccoides]XP_044381844.1 zinc finger A20 and AN1 domain-containing stress-associated protein 1-like [Triticum aestivum]KAF7059470.1 hypothetical protein CFC21_066374 [Triticum aestivum]VAI18941.1 unnamed protein product [Triticum turgidum subsp. durum]